MVVILYAFFLSVLVSYKTIAVNEMNYEYVYDEWNHF